MDANPGVMQFSGGRSVGSFYPWSYEVGPLEQPLKHSQPLINAPVRGRWSVCGCNQPAHRGRTKGGGKEQGPGCEIGGRVNELNESSVPAAASRCAGTWKLLLQRYFAPDLEPAQPREGAILGPIGLRDARCHVPLRYLLPYLHRPPRAAPACWTEIPPQSMLMLAALRNRGRHDEGTTQALRSAAGLI